MSRRPRQKPDLIAHRLVTNEGSSVRVYLDGGVATIPVEPYRDEGGMETETVPVASFDAVVESIEIVDGGLNLFGVDGLQLSASEWHRIGLQKHWEAPDVNLSDRNVPHTRTLEVWASREDAIQDAESTAPPFSHLESIPAESPVITAWAAGSPTDSPDQPPVPLSRPTLILEAIAADGVGDTQGFNRVEVGAIAAVEELDEGGPQPRDPEP